MNRYVLWAVVSLMCLGVIYGIHNPFLAAVVILYWVSWGFILREDTQYVCFWYGLPLRWDIGSYVYIEVHHWTIYEPRLIGPFRLP